MSRRSTVQLNTTELTALKERLAPVKGSYVKVGLLVDAADRGVVPLGSGYGPIKPSGLNNPTLGLIHEKGSTSQRIPRRSFLEEPLKTRLPERIRQVGAATWRKLILQKGPVVALQFLGVEGENVVQGAFDTGGYGRWAPLSQVTIDKKGSDAILIETAQMRKAVRSAVVKKTA